MNEKRNPNQKPQSHSGLKLADIYYVLFRHKWLILVCATLGLIAAGIIYVKRPTVYTSEATVMVRTIYDPNISTQPDTEHTQNVYGGPEGLINSEVVILNSFDLALRVATNVTPKKILAAYGGGDDVQFAASVLHNNLSAERISRTSVLKITLTQPEEASVREILGAVITEYQSLHTEIHAKSDAYVQLEEQAAGLQNKLHDTQRQLQEKQKQVGVIDVEGARKASEAMAQKISYDIFTTGAELEQHQEFLAKLNGTASKATNAVAATNTVAEPEIPKEKLERYAQQVQLLDRLKNDYLNLLSTYSDQSVIAKEKKGQIEKAKNLIAQLEKDEPRLAQQKLATSGTATGQNNSNSLADQIANEENQIGMCQYKLKVLNGEAAQIRASITNYDAVASDVHDLQLNIGLLEEKWRSCESKAENAKIESNLQELNKASISPVEHPTPPSRESSKTPKMMAVAAAAGIFGGLALAFLLELYVDHTVKRPKEIEGELGMRLFLSIPDVNRNGHRCKALAAAKKEPHVETAENGNGAEMPVANGDAQLEIAPWDERHSMHQYNEQLRDRLISYFDSNNLNHKPKLVAVTGSSKGAGTSTIAAGLAASLSETGDGNVLLVDMNMKDGGAKQFYMGKPDCELDTALESETRSTALIQHKLYVVNGSSNGDKLSRMLPKNFANLMPKLKASDYDYIIFDMPPVGRTGVTQRLAGFMDMMLLVVEAEKTSRDVVKQAGALLQESKANVSVVLNKTRSYVPARLHQEF